MSARSLLSIARITEYHYRTRIGSAITPVNRKMSNFGAMGQSVLYQIHPVGLAKLAEAQEKIVSESWGSAADSFKVSNSFERRKRPLKRMGAIKNSRLWGYSICHLLLGLLALSPGFTPTEAPAQTNFGAIVSGPRENRWLLIVETSRAMKPRAEGTLQSVKQALSTGMHGQLSRGDSIGVWTFNEQLYTGRFPLQDWVPDHKDGVIDRVSKFLQEQKYEKRASLGSVMPTLGNVVKNSPFITIVLVSAGKDDLHGSPFDTEINQAYARWRTSQEKARMPLVTVLRAQRGKFIYHSVSPAPTDIALSELPSEPPPPKTPPKRPAVMVTQKTPQTVLPPLIVSGKKPTREPAPLAPEVAEAKSSTEALKSTPSTMPAPTNDARPTVSAPAAMLAAVPANNSAPRVTPSVIAPPPNTVESATAGTATTAVPKANLTASSQPSSAAQATETRAVVAKAEHTVATSEPNVINPQGTSPPKSETFAEAASSPTTEPGPAIQQSKSSPTTETIAETGESKSAPTLSRAFLTSKGLGLGIAALLALGVVVLVISLRRARAESFRHVSLITRSLDRGPNQN